MPQISLRTLLLLVALLSAALAAIVSASEFAEYTLKFAIAACPPIAILLAIYSEGGRRAFWTGLSVFGLWSYFFLFTDMGIGYVVWNPLRKVYDEHAKEAILALHRHRLEDLAVNAIAGDRINGMPQTPEQVERRIATDLPRATSSIAHEIVQRSFDMLRYSIGLAVPVIGGFLACWLHRRREMRRESPG